MLPAITEAINKSDHSMGIIEKSIRIILTPTKIRTIAKP